MSNSIYGSFTWLPNTQYYKNDIVTNDNSTFYYAAQDYLSSSVFATDVSAGNLIGYINYLGANKPYFTWKSSYKYNNKDVPRVRKIQFGDGYFQIAPDGINTILMNLTLPFHNLDIGEYTAIIHFLRTRNGVESFVFVPPPPYNIQKLFKATEWNVTQNFYNNYDMDVTFVESPV